MQSSTFCGGQKEEIYYLWLAFVFGLTACLRMMMMMTPTAATKKVSYHRRLCLRFGPHHLAFVAAPDPCRSCPAPWRTAAAAASAAAPPWCTGWAPAAPPPTGTCRQSQGGRSQSRSSIAAWPPGGPWPAPGGRSAGSPRGPRGRRGRASRGRWQDQRRVKSRRRSACLQIRTGDAAASAAGPAASRSSSPGSQSCKIQVKIFKIHFLKNTERELLPHRCSYCDWSWNWDALKNKMGIGAIWCLLLIYSEIMIAALGQQTSGFKLGQEQNNKGSESGETDSRQSLGRDWCRQVASNPCFIALSTCPEVPDPTS